MHVTVCSMTSIAALDNGCCTNINVIGKCLLLLLDGLGCLEHPVVQPSAVHQRSVPPNSRACVYRVRVDPLLN